MRRQHRLTDQLIGKADQAHGGEIPGCTGVADGRIDCGDYEERHTEKEELEVAHSRRATGVLFFFPIVGRSLQAGQARLLAHGASFKSVPGLLHRPRKLNCSLAFTPIMLLFEFLRWVGVPIR